MFPVQNASSGGILTRRIRFARCFFQNKSPDRGHFHDGVRVPEEVFTLIRSWAEREKKPEFLFVQFDSIDGAGHTYGYGTEKYLAALETADAYVARIREAVEKAGIAEDTLFIATADHGGFDHGHGGVTDEEKYVFFAAVGKTVKPGATLDMRVRDIPAIVLHALGLPADPNWEAKLPEGMFTE